MQKYNLFCYDRPMAKKQKAQADYPFKTVNNLLNKVDLIKNIGSLIKIKSSKKIYIVLLIIIIILLAVYKKSWFVAATVNTTPITGLELQMRLNEQFKDQILNQLINEKIILDEARKGNALPTEVEIDQKISELETNVGGAEVLDSLLIQQGQTRVTLRDQIRLQLAISKLYDNQASISAEEVENFIKQNAASLQSTDSAKQKEEAFNLLKQQKVSQIFNQKFQELRQKANIKIF